MSDVLCINPMIIESVFYGVIAGIAMATVFVVIVAIAAWNSRKDGV